MAAKRTLDELGNPRALTRKVLRLRGFGRSALKAHDLIASAAYVVIKAANEFKDKTTAIIHLWHRVN